MLKVKPLITRFLLLLFVIAQLYFVLAIVKEKIIEPWLLLIFVLFILAMVLSYKKKHRLHIPTHFEIDYWVFLWFLIGSFSTYFLQHNLQFNTVLSAGMVGFVGSFTSKIKKIPTSKSWPVVIYCGAFVGMTKLELGYIYLFTATLLTSLFYTFTQHYFHGIGGKLGTLAFMGVLYSYLIFRLFS